MTILLTKYSILVQDCANLASMQLISLLGPVYVGRGVKTWKHWFFIFCQVGIFCDNEDLDLTEP